jgi:hypothetical protein
MARRGFAGKIRQTCHMLYADAKRYIIPAIRKGVAIMKLMILFGDAAVGKMTVGQELAKITDLRLFHNHMTIEPVIDIFGFYDGKTIKRLRDAIFEEFSRSNQYGMIFTFMWAFDQQSDWDYIKHVSNIFREQNADIYYVELVAPLEVRLERNVTENRLNNKASKRSIEESNKRLLDDYAKYRCTSNEGEIQYENYMRIDNTNIEPEKAAEMIKERFAL